MTGADIDSSLARAAARLFADACPPEVVTRAETDGLDPRLWKAVEEIGFTLVGIDERAGGSGGTLPDLLVLLAAAGRHAVPLPLAETHLAAWLLAGSGQRVPPGPATVIPGTDRDTLALRDDTLDGVAHDVPWARAAGRIVALLPDGWGRPRVVTIDPAALDIRPGLDLAGLPRDVVEAVGVPVEHTAWAGSGGAVFPRGALLRSALMAGALEEILEITRRYVGERVQFGRPIGAFQSVQQHVVTLAQMAAMSSLAVTRAGRAALTADATFEICATKLVVNQNAAAAVRAAHQAHGAIGMTREYRLQQFTRRLAAWRGEFGDDQGLAARLGAGVTRAGSLSRVVTAAPGTREV